jgi:carboxylesterase
MKPLEPRARPFFYSRGSTGCLLIHGFPGAPEEMRWLGGHLAAHDITAIGVRLFGLGTQPKDLFRARKEHWIANVEDGIALLKQSCDQIFLIGLSIGGVLAFNIGSRFPVAGIVAMATPAALPPLAGRLRPIIRPLSLLWRYRKPPEDPYWHDQEAKALNLHYPVQPVRAIAEVYDLVEETRSCLQLVTTSVLLIYSNDDDSVLPEDAGRIYSLLGSNHKTLERIERSGHNIPRDSEREWVFERITSFVQGISRGNP